MRPRLQGPFLIPIILVLAACSVGPSATIAPQKPVEDKAGPLETSEETNQGSLTWPDGQSLLDDQGQVTVEVTPVNLNAPGATLEFRVALNTHSVDLSMDLAGLATLTTDSGQRVSATLWNAPIGGHHVSGVLSFPAGTDGVPLLDGASRVTLSILGVDTPERVFTWNAES